MDALHSVLNEAGRRMNTCNPRTKVYLRIVYLRVHTVQCKYARARVCVCTVWIVMATYQEVKFLRKTFAWDHFIEVGECEAGIKRNRMFHYVYRLQE